MKFSVLLIALLAGAQVSAQTLQDVLVSCEEAYERGDFQGTIDSGKQVVTHPDATKGAGVYGTRLEQCVQRAAKAQNELVDRRTFVACAALYRQDQNAAIIEPVCNAVFRTRGFPVAPAN